MRRGDLKEKIISGIQQIGIGVGNLREAWNWYRENFGMDIRVFEEDAVAELMLPYTGGQPQARHAALALNLQGGGGFEIWQYTKRIPVPPKNQYPPWGPGHQRRQDQILKRQGQLPVLSEQRHQY